MKTLEHGDLETTIGALFRRWPLLCGFSVQALPESDVVLADVSLYPSPGRAQSQQLAGEIAAALLDLIDERPEARELLRGRTFTRTLH